MRFMLYSLISLVLLSNGEITFAETEPQPVTTRLTQNGKAVLPIIISKQANEATRNAAATLADYLQRITDVEFEVTEGNGTSGIILGRPADFSEIPLSPDWSFPKLMERENYLLVTFDKGLYLLGATDRAIEHAVWDFLHHLGYRQYFPGEHWEIIPKISELKVAINREESPDYYTRLIWYGYGPWDHGREALDQWQTRNRIKSAIKLDTGHAYGRIIRAHREEFAAHPEYRALVDGERHLIPYAKFCISNPELRKLVVRYALNQFEKAPELDTISMDPSDGGDWCECQNCKEMGSVSDRALFLANQVARAINQDSDKERYVGMYAYNYHSPPPTIDVDPHVVISVATAFIRGGYKLDDLLTGWADKGATLGIRDYYSVSPWDRDMPGKTRASNLKKLQQQIPHYYRTGARFNSAESGESWGTTGLGHYFASRMLWDIDEADHLDEILNEFFDNCFGPAATPMRKFYEQLDGSQTHLMLEDQLARMYRALQAARNLTNDQAILTRLDDLTLYTRYADLYGQYTNARGARRQAAFETLIKYVYRMRHAKLIHAYALYRDMHKRDKNVSIPEGAAWNVPEDENPWKSSERFTRAELDSYLQTGIAAYQPVELDFEPVTFSEQLVPATELKFDSKPLKNVWTFRNRFQFYSYATKPNTEFKLEVTGGLIKHYRDRGNIKINLWKIGGPSATGELETLITTDTSVPPDGNSRPLNLKVKEPGLYRFDLTDGGDMTRIHWKSTLPMSVRSSMEHPQTFYLRNNFYFYVPHETEVIGFFSGGKGSLLNPEGTEVKKLEGLKPGYHSVKVPPSLRGQLWQFRNISGSLRLMTVPPYFTKNPTQIIQPSDVVK